MHKAVKETIRALCLVWCFLYPFFLSGIVIDAVTWHRAENWSKVGLMFLGIPAVLVHMIVVVTYFAVGPADQSAGRRPLLHPQSLVNYAVIGSVVISTLATIIGIVA